MVSQLAADEASPVRAGGSVSVPVLLRDLSRVLQRTLMDKAAPVFAQSCRLLEVTLAEAAKANKGSGDSSAGGAAVRDEVRGLVESVSRAMADRLSSSNGREREQASQILTYLALHKVSPPAAVPTVLLAPLKSKEKEHPTPLRARSVLLQTLLQRVGLLESSGLSVAAVMKFALVGLTHRDAAVRDGAFNLVTLVCQQTDRKKVDLLLKDVPASTLASLEQRIADVRDGRYAIPAAAVPDRPFDDRVAVSQAAAASSLSPRQRQHVHVAQRAAAETVEANGDAPGRRKAAKADQASHTAREAVSPAREQRHQPHKDAAQPANSQHRAASKTADKGKSSADQQRAALSKADDSPSTTVKQRATARSHAVKAERDDTYSDEQYDGESPQQQQAAAGGRAAVGSTARVVNAGSPSHYRLSHASEAEPSSGHDDSNTTGTAEGAEETGTETGAEEEEQAGVAGDGGYPVLQQLPHNKCQFCGLEDESFSDAEDALDLHYWQACPMLLSCPHCEQVVEIPTFAEHLTSECESEGHWTACTSCGWVVDEAQLAEHEADCGGMRAGWAAGSCPRRIRR